MQERIPNIIEFMEPPSNNTFVNGIIERQSHSGDIFFTVLLNINSEIKKGTIIFKIAPMIPKFAYPSARSPGWA